LESELKLPKNFQWPDDMEDIIFLDGAAYQENEILLWCFEEQIEADFIARWSNETGTHTAWRVVEPAMRTVFTLKYL